MTGDGKASPMCPVKEDLDKRGEAILNKQLREGLSYSLLHAICTIGTNL